jgi:hypothetical protein
MVGWFRELGLPKIRVLGGKRSSFFEQSFQERVGNLPQKEYLGKSTQKTQQTNLYAP